MHICAHRSVPRSANLIKDKKGVITVAPFYVTIHSYQREYTVYFYRIDNDLMRGLHTNADNDGRWRMFDPDGTDRVFSRTFNFIKDHNTEIELWYSENKRSYFIMKCTDGSFHVYQAAQYVMGDTAHNNNIHSKQPSEDHKLTALYPILSSLTVDLNYIHIHASSAVYRQKSILFLGPSGAGKSTSVDRLVSEKAEICKVSDDTTRIFQNTKNDSFTVGDPNLFFYDNGIPSNRDSYIISSIQPNTLKAIFILHKNNKPILTKADLGDLQNLRSIYMMAEPFRLVHKKDPKRIAHAFALFTDCLRATPTFNLGLGKTSDIWGIISSLLN
ncbi:MAG: hypothetical protein JW938_01480 [Candidatus Omnitrophica bacterium]|nr:hypothetical protein [Candidatus Omnitrophota bacterium]